MTTPPTPRQIDVERLRAKVEARSRDRTHSDECYLWDDHRDCAILALLAELEAARAVVEAARPWRNTDLIGPLSKLAGAVQAYDRAIAAAADDGRDGG